MNGETTVADVQEARRESGKGPTDLVPRAWVMQSLVGGGRHFRKCHNKHPQTLLDCSPKRLLQFTCRQAVYEYNFPDTRCYYLIIFKKLMGVKLYLIVTLIRISLLGRLSIYLLISIYLTKT